MSSDVENGMYCIDKDYKILCYNHSMKQMYPEIEEGRYCYHAIAFKNDVCTFCPLREEDNQSTFYNDERHEWIHAQAAEAELPGMEKCYSIIVSKSYEKEQLVRKHIESLNNVNDSLQKSLADEQNYNKQISEKFDKEIEANHSKSSFLFNMSHEIRTEMNAIIGFAKIGMANLEDHDKVAYCFDKIETSSNLLLEQLNDIIDMARIGSGKLIIEEKDCDFIEFINNMENTVRSDMKHRDLSFIVDTSGLRDTYLICDTMHLGQVILNLLSNAMKFNSEGGHVWLTVDQEYSYDDNAVDINISVKDDGIGISEEFLAHIFDAFEKERGASEIEFQGMGLGLTIAKKIIEALNGKISVKSMPDIGSEFIVSLKLKKAKHKEKAFESIDSMREAFRGKRALLVDDNEINREIAMTFLSDIGLEIDEAYDGREAVNMICNSTEGYYDVVFMDIQMPIMNGYDATRTIRGLSRDDVRNMPIFAMTANAFAEDIHECIESGMNDHIAKPINMEHIVSLLKNYLK